MSTDDIRIERDGARADLILSRPRRHNALTEAMWLAIPDLLAPLAEDEDLRLLVVRGTGGSFASGADISEFETVYATLERAEAYSNGIADGLNALADFPKPTLAAIEGVCIGGGCGLALACDLRFAAAGSRFGITPAKMGLAYPFNDTKRLAEAVGLSTAKDLLFTGRHVSAEEALQIGLIDRLLEPDQLAATVSDYVALLETRSSVTARITKAMLTRLEAGQTDEDPVTRQWFLDAFNSADFKEGFRAFLDKRTPDFKRKT